MMASRGTASIRGKPRQNVVIGSFDGSPRDERRRPVARGATPAALPSASTTRKTGRRRRNSARSGRMSIGHSVLAGRARANRTRGSPAGRFLRRSSLDELPQLWNVLAGDMSLVGPRSMMPCQQALYPGEAYYRLRPGLTGPWQVSDRHASAFADRARFDRDYEQALSLATDLRILAATLRAVLRGTGC